MENQPKKIKKKKESKQIEVILEDTPIINPPNPLKDPEEEEETNKTKINPSPIAVSAWGQKK